MVVAGTRDVFSFFLGAFGGPHMRRAVQALCPRRFDLPSRSLAIFFLLFFQYASMALLVEHTVLLVGSFHGWLGVDVALEFAQGRVA